MDRADCRGAGGWCCSFSREGLIIIIRRQQFIDAKLSVLSKCTYYEYLQLDDFIFSIEIPILLLLTSKLNFYL